MCMICVCLQVYGPAGAPDILLFLLDGVIREGQGASRGEDHGCA